MATFALPLLVLELRGWPVYLVVPLTLYALVVWAVAPLRRSVRWLHLGQLDRWTCAAIAAIVLVSSSALLGWYVLFRPDVRDLAEQIPAWAPATLVLAGAVFAIVNAVLEEVIWRGVMLEAWTTQLGVAGAVLAQAVAFGVIHAQGFPRGLSGVVMASLYGLMLGGLRLRAKGLAAPVLAHIGADATIFAILVGAVSG
jgi:membrane protease YdiL (CAAX protease family)